MAVSDSVEGILHENVTLQFRLGFAVPSATLQDINVTFNQAPILDGELFSLQPISNLFTISINSLTLADEGVYTVTVVTEAGNDTAEASLAVYGEKRDWYLCVQSAWSSLPVLAA